MTQQLLNCLLTGNTDVFGVIKMGSVFKPLSFVLNILYIFLSFALSAGSIWFFIEMSEITNLRNSDRYLLDFKIYWPQVVPWMFAAVGMMGLLISLCGFCGAHRSSKSVLVMYIIFLSVAIVGSVASAVFALLFADCATTDDFLSEIISDALLQMRKYSYVTKAFGNIERKLRCCGAKSPGDYTSWMDRFPDTCCGTKSFQSCDFSNSIALDRHGCIEVATKYSRLFIEVLSGASVIAAIIGLLNLIVALKLCNSLRRKPKTFNDIHEVDTLKIPRNK